MHSQTHVDEHKNLIPSLRRTIINVLLVATQFGFCCVYFIFWGINLQQVPTKNEYVMLFSQSTDI